MPNVSLALWVEIISRGTGASGRALAKPYEIEYSSGMAASTSRLGDPRKRFAGNAPVIVDRIDGEVHITGTTMSLESYLADYEATLPPARHRK